MPEQTQLFINTQTTKTTTLPVPGHVAGLITAEVRAASVGDVEVVRRWDYLCMLVHVFGRGCVMWIFLGVTMPDHTRRRCDQAYEGSTPAHNRIGVG